MSHSTQITIDTVGPTLIGGYPVEDRTSTFHTLFFDESINEERLFDGYFLLSGPGIAAPISLDTFFIDLESDEIDVSLDPLATGVYTISVNTAVEDIAGNLLNPASSNTTDFEVLANPVYLDDDTVWDQSLHEGKDLVIDGAELVVSDTHSVASLWLLNGAVLRPVAGQALDLTVTGDVLVDDISSIDADGAGDAGGATATIGDGPGGGAIGTDGGGGGSHGGAGGIGGSAADAAAGATHGSDVMPDAQGSGGGGSAASTGGAGGGALKLIVTGEVTIDGTVSADGATGIGVNASGGAGGSIWILANAISGAGVLTSLGGDALGDGGVGTGGAGGGGRIAVDVTDNQFAGTVSVDGGVGTDVARHGLVGTSIATTPFPDGNGGAPSPAAAGASGSDKRAKKNKRKHALKNVMKFTFTGRASDWKREAKKRDILKKISKRQSVTIKKLKPGTYQVS